MHTCMRAHTCVRARMDTHTTIVVKGGQKKVLCFLDLDVGVGIGAVLNMKLRINLTVGFLLGLY